MTTKNVQRSGKPRKKTKLRYLEYYDFQPELDALYENSLKGYKFKNLMPLILDERNMALAYRNIKRNKGSVTKGVDGVTISEWETKTPETYYNYLRSRFRNYIPQAVRRVEIPKDNGKTRPLGIPTMGDRFVQQCIKQVLEPICEAKFFDHNYGFRPNRDTHGAIAQFQALIHIQYCHYVVDVDIKGFFDNVDHAKLMKQMWALGIRDKNLLCIIGKMLKAEIVGQGIPSKGVPQGGILSPLLSNIVLNELDWWLAGQWETFKTKHTYWSSPTQKNNARYRSLRKKNLKEIYLVRYADDFKILCKDIKTANKIFIAIKEWLLERLGLEISPEKSKIVNLLEEHSEFLGLSFKAVKKGIPPEKRRGRNANKSEKVVIESHLSDKSIKKVKIKLKKAIANMQKRPNKGSVELYNSVVLGEQQYYKIATHVNLDFNKIAYEVNKVLHNRTKSVQNKTKRIRRKPSHRKKSSALSQPKQRKVNKDPPDLIVSEAYNEFYKNNYKKVWIAKTILFPIGDIKTEKAYRFNQSICNYTASGRALIHDERAMLNMNTLHYLARNPVVGESIEYNDNRVSLYSGQYGLCYVTGEPLIIGDMEVHHRIPRNMGGSDRYNNLHLVTYNVHKLIHTTKKDTIEFYLKLINPDERMLKKLNKLRLDVGNMEIIIA